MFHHLLPSSLINLMICRSIVLGHACVNSSQMNEISVSSVAGKQWKLFSGKGNFAVLRNKPFVISIQKNYLVTA